MFPIPYRAASCSNSAFAVFSPCAAPLIFCFRSLRLAWNLVYYGLLLCSGCGLLFVLLGICGVCLALCSLCGVLLGRLFSWSFWSPSSWYFACVVGAPRLYHSSTPPLLGAYARLLACIFVFLFCCLSIAYVPLSPCISVFLLVFCKLVLLLGLSEQRLVGALAVLVLCFVVCLLLC